MEDLLRDLRYAIRALSNSPGFTFVAILTLALGIGVNSTIFSLVNAILLKPLPVEAPEELVDIYGHTETSSSHDTSSYPNYLDYRQQSETLSGIMGYTNFFANLSIQGSSELVVGELVTDNYFSVLGVQPALGRAFSPDEFAAPGAAPVAILSHPFWQTRFAGDPGVLGQTLRMNGIVYTVIGVAPKSFGGMFPAVTAQMWVPVAMVEEVEPLGNQRNSGRSPGDTRLERRGQHWLWLKGRMNPGVAVEEVRTELDGIAARLSQQYPETNALERLTLLRTNDVAVNPDFDRTLMPAGMVLLGAVGLVLLVACANLANMLLARAATRRRELAIRLAIGANRGQVIRQLFTESMALALAGGTVALLLAFWLARLIARFQPPLPIELGLDITPDWRVLLFTLAAAALTGIVFGLIPALRASRPDLVPALKDTGEGPSRRGRRVELRDALVVVQVAVSLVLLVAGSLMVRSLGAAQRVDLGYDLDRTAYLGLAMEMNGYDSEQAGIFYESGRLRLDALPEVESVGLTSRVPLSLNNNGFGVFIDGHQSSGSDRPYVMDGASVDENYFEALALTVVAGRGIEPSRAGVPALMGGPAVPDRRDRGGLQGGHPRRGTQALSPPAATAAIRLRQLPGAHDDAGRRAGAGPGARAPVPRPRSGIPRHGHHAGVGRRAPLPHSRRRLAHRCLRTPGLGIGSRGPLRRHRLLREPPGAGDRRPQGAGGRDQSRGGTGPSPGHGARGNRRSRRCRPCGPERTLPLERAVRRLVRPRELPGRLRRARPGGGARELDPGAPGVPGGSHGGAQGRVAGLASGAVRSPRSSLSIRRAWRRGAEVPLELQERDRH
jgi:predicted permease